jgi:hypothetical protein
MSLYLICIHLVIMERSRGWPPTPYGNSVRPRVSFAATRPATILPPRHQAGHFVVSERTYGKVHPGMPSSFGGEARVVADSLSIGRAMISMAEIQPDALIPCGELCDIQMENGFWMRTSLVKQSRIPPRIRPRFLKRVQNPEPLSDDTSPDDDKREVPKESPIEPTPAPASGAPL